MHCHPVAPHTHQCATALQKRKQLTAYNNNNTNSDNNSNNGNYHWEWQLKNANVSQSGHQKKRIQEGGYYFIFFLKCKYPFSHVCVQIVCMRVVSASSQCTQSKCNFLSNNIHQHLQINSVSDTPIRKKVCMKVNSLKEKTFLRCIDKCISQFVHTQSRVYQ